MMRWNQCPGSRRAKNPGAIWHGVPLIVAQPARLRQR